MTEAGTDDGRWVMGRQAALPGGQLPRGQLRRGPAEPDPAVEPSPELAELLARLQVATQLRDGAAATRILDRLADSEDGQWLLRQCVAAGLRDLAGQLTDPSVRSIGAA